MNPSTLSHQIRRGLGFVFLSTAGSRLLSFAVDVALMRLLSVGVFGMMAFGLLVVNTLNLLRSLGIGEALIFHEEEDRESRDTGLVMAVSVGLLLYGGVWAGAPWLVALAQVGQPRELVEVVRVLATLAVVQALGTVPSALLERALAFERKFWVDTLPTVAYAALGLGLALLGKGVWSLVWARLGAACVSTVMAWSLARWRPGIRFSWRSVRRIARYGRFVTGAALVSFLVVNIDDALVVRLTGVEGLGYYARAYLLANLPVTAVSHIVARVAFPAYARMRTGKADVEALFARLVKGVLLVSLPFAALMVLLPGAFTRALFGPRWLPLVSLLPWLGVYGVLRAVLSNTGPLFNGLGAPQAILQINLLQLGLLSLLLYPLILWRGPEGACQGMLLGTLFSAPLALRFVQRLSGLGPRRLGRMLTPLLVPAAAMAAVMGAVSYGWEHAGLGVPAAQLVVAGGAGVGVYLGALLRWRRPLLQDVSLLVSGRTSVSA